MEAFEGELEADDLHRTSCVDLARDIEGEDVFLLLVLLAYLHQVVALLRTGLKDGLRGATVKP